MAMLEVDAEEVMRAIVPQSTAETAVKSTGGRG
jgi:hypothetical protein